MMINFVSAQLSIEDNDDVRRQKAHNNQNK